MAKLDFDRHFYLYAKNHYQPNGVMNDLKVLMAKRCGMDLEYVQSKDIMEILLKLAHKTLRTSDAYNFADFFQDILPRNWWKLGRAPNTVNKECIDEEDLIQAICAKCLSVLCNLKVVDIDIELGEPDPSILPLREKD